MKSILKTVFREDEGAGKTSGQVVDEGHSERGLETGQDTGSVPGQSGAGRRPLGKARGQGPGRGTNSVTGPITGGGEVTRTVTEWADPGYLPVPEGGDYEVY